MTVVLVCGVQIVMLDSCKDDLDLLVWVSSGG
jgi:hypothetical protein